MVGLGFGVGCDEKGRQRWRRGFISLPNGGEFDSGCFLSPGLDGRTFLG